MHGQKNTTISFTFYLRGSGNLMKNSGLVNHISK